MRRWATAAVLALVGSGSGFIASPAEAAVVNVPAGGNIQQAVNQASPGDVIQLEAGEYHGGIEINKSIVIRGVGDDTVVRGGTACGGPTGFCVFGDEATGTRVRDVTIRNLRVRGYDEFGILGFLTRDFVVAEVTSVNNLVYGIGVFDGRATVVRDNVVRGSTGLSGIYIGDSVPSGDSRIVRNRVTDSVLGIFLRHNRGMVVRENIVRDNCLGILLLNDGQEGGIGNITVRENRVNQNNRFCPAGDDSPELQGGGIFLEGADHVTVAANEVNGNQGSTEGSGGIVLTDGAANNEVRGNTAHNNQPFDLIDESGNNTNFFGNNDCGTSDPPGLC